MYKIKISYRTGNSYTSSDEVDFIQMEWNSLDIVKENLNRIKSHYQMYDWFEDFENMYLTPEKYHNKIMSYKDAPWFCYDQKVVRIKDGKYLPISPENKHLFEDAHFVPDDFTAKHYLMLKLDSGEEMKFSAFWCGHFERLYYAEISPKPDPYRFDTK
jgi:hypothetical protein